MNEAKGRQKESTRNDGGTPNNARNEASTLHAVKGTRNEGGEVSVESHVRGTGSARRGDSACSSMSHTRNESVESGKLSNVRSAMSAREEGGTENSADDVRNDSAASRTESTAKGRNAKK